MILAYPYDLSYERIIIFDLFIDLHDYKIYQMVLVYLYARN